VGAAGYLVDAHQRPLGQESYVTPGTGNPVWTWLLTDAAGNVATHLDDSGTVTQQVSYTPYGKLDPNGSDRRADATEPSTLGFGAAMVDSSTSQVILGPRQYDPDTARFGAPDTFASAAQDQAAGADPVLSNRYLFAGANPVSYADDGHCLAGKDTTVQQVDDYNVYVEQVWVDDPTHYGGGYHYPHVVQEPVYKTKTECVHTGFVGQFIDYANGNDVERKVEDPSYHNSFSAAETVGAKHAPAVIKLAATAVAIAAIPEECGIALALGAVATGGYATSAVIDPSRCRGERLAFSLFTSGAGLSLGAVVSGIVTVTEGSELAGALVPAGRVFSAAQVAANSVLSFPNKC